ncbi:hypothetical protein E6C27_scaffold48829G00010 [Cucumis melo var. makuwa]|nr:hypothetical protein E6C27_scaffold48829G00010 [Cucumis melo var. makuwa]
MNKGSKGLDLACLQPLRSPSLRSLAPYRLPPLASQGGSQRVGIDCSSLWEFLRKAIFSKSNLKKDGVRANPFRRMRRTVVREFARKNWRTKGFDHSLRSKARFSAGAFRAMVIQCMRLLGRLHPPIVFFFFFAVSTFGIGLTLEGPTKLVSRPPLRIKLGKKSFLFSSARIADEKVMPVTNAKNVAAADMETIFDGPRGEELEPDKNPQASLLQEPTYLAIGKSPSVEAAPNTGGSSASWGQQEEERV